MEFLVGIAVAVGVVWVAVFALVFTSRNRQFLRVNGKRRPKIPAYRPVKRYKSKIRGIGIDNKLVNLGIVTRSDGSQEQRYLGVDRKHWVRFYPNLGFTVAGYHWCRKGIHDGTVRTSKRG